MCLILDPGIAQNSSTLATTGFEREGRGNRGVGGVSTYVTSAVSKYCA